MRDEEQREPAGAEKASRPQGKADTCESQRGRMHDWGARASDSGAFQECLSQPSGEHQSRDCSEKNFELGGNCHAVCRAQVTASKERGLDFNSGADPDGTAVGGY